jgi:hypothetical protein
MICAPLLIVPSYADEDAEEAEVAEACAEVCVSLCVLPVLCVLVIR